MKNFTQAQVNHLNNLYKTKIVDDYILAYDKITNKFICVFDLGYRINHGLTTYYINN